MIQPRDETHRALKRMLSNGPLAAIPKRPSDQHLLVALAAAQFEPQRTYRESEVNETLLAWIETFCEPDGLDHVTLRRMLVDFRLLTRTKSGSTYHLDHEKLAAMQVPSRMRWTQSPRNRFANRSWLGGKPSQP